MDSSMRTTKSLLSTVHYFIHRVSLYKEGFACIFLNPEAVLSVGHNFHIRIISLGSTLFISLVNYDELTGGCARRPERADRESELEEMHHMTLFRFPFRHYPKMSNVTRYFPISFPFSPLRFRRDLANACSRSPLAAVVGGGPLVPELWSSARLLRLNRCIGGL